MPVTQLPYTEDNQPLLSLLSRMPFPALLESNGQAPAGTIQPSSNTHRYSIFSACPQQSFTVRQPMDVGDFYNKIRSLKQEYLSLGEALRPELARLPFQGGVVGFMGYPRIANKTSLQISDGYIGLYQWAVVVDHQLKTSSLVFHPNCPPSVQQEITAALSSIRPDTHPPLPKFQLNSSFKAHTSFRKYQQCFDKVKNYILEGDCYQVNLTQGFSAECCGNPFSAYQTLRHASPAPFSAYFHWGHGALLSVSPERFIRNEGRTLTTNPIKGTRPRKADPTADAQQAHQLATSVKDKAENLMIVDLLRNDLSRVSKVGSVKAPELFALRSFSNVHHLVSTVTGTLAEQYDSIDLLSACFPGGSITGAPKLRAMEIIEELEPSPRGVYCGSVFYWAASGDFDSNIAIRSLQWNKGRESTDTIHCWAGGGIVADSSCESEYQECFDKVQHLIKALETC